MQDLTNKGQPGRWAKSGTIVEVLPHDAYLVKVHGSRALTKRNRRFLRKITPFTPASPVSLGDSIAVPPLHSQPLASTAAAASTAPPGAPRQDDPAPPVHPQPPPLPVIVQHQEPAHMEAPTAETHRLQPAGAPGQPNILDLLYQREEAGLHLALEMDWKAFYH